MKNKSRIRIILIALLVIVISLSVGFGTWIISNNINAKPDNLDNTTKKVITKYLNGTSTTFDGNIQLPTPRTFNDYLTLNPDDLTYFYREANSDSGYVECVKDEVGPRDAGEYEIKVDYKFTDDNIFTLSGLKFTIKKYTLKLGDTTVDFENCTYNSLEQTPSFTVSVKINDKSFTLNKNDYTTVYSNNINATSTTSLAKAKSTINDLCQNFDGSFESNFEIAKRNVNDDLIVYDDLDENELQYTGSEIQPTINLYLALTNNNKIPLTKGTDYNLSYKNNVSGPGIISIQGINNYTGTREVTFEIIGAPKLINLADVTIDQIESVVYNGTEQTPELSVSIGGTKLVQGVHFNAKYSNNINAGIAKVTLNPITDKSYNSNETTFIINKAKYKLKTKGTLAYSSGDKFIEGSTIEASGYELIDINNNTVACSESINTDGLIFNDKSSETFTSGVVIIFNPLEKNDNYESFILTEQVTIYAVATINTTYYGTVERALTAANSGDQVFLIPERNPVLKNDAEIKSGVTLNIVYETNKLIKNRNGSNGTFADAESNKGKYLKNSLTIDSNVTLTNNGTLNIDGVTGHAGVGLSAQTSGNYTQIILGQDSKIISNGIIYCLGYIKEATKSNDSIVEIKNGSLSAPFVIYDFKGGSASRALNDKNVCPFNIFDLPNIHSNLKVYSSAQYIGLTDIYIGTNSTHYNNDVTIIGPSSANSLFMLENGYINLKYNTNESKLITNTAGNMNISIHGNCTTGSIKVKMTIFITVTIDTSSYFCPISWKMNISLESGTTTIKTKFKFMPGSKMSVGKNAKLVLDNECVFYETYNVTAGTQPYPNNKPASELTVVGNCEIKNAFGGIIKSTDSKASISFAGYNSITILTDGDYANSSYQPVYSNTTFYAKGNIDKTGDLTDTFNSNSFYVSTDDYWTSQTNDGSYTVNYHYFDENGNEVIQSIEYKIFSGSTPSIPLIPDPIRPYYEFVGWFKSDYTTHYDENVTIENGKTYDIYAKYDVIEYTIEYIDLSGNTTFESAILTYENYSSFTIANKPLDGMTFIGWYIKENWTNSDTAIPAGTSSSSAIFKLLEYMNKYNVNALTLYGRYDQMFKVSFVTNIDNITIEDKYVVANACIDDLQTISINVSSMNNDYLSQKYFTKWIDKDGNEITSFTPITKDMTLYACYEDKKFTITYTGGDEDVVHYTNQTDSYFLLSSYNKADVGSKNPGDSVTKYILSNWTINSTFYEKKQSIAISENITVYANWIENKYCYISKVNSNDDITITINNKSINYVDGYFEIEYGATIKITVIHAYDKDCKLVVNDGTGEKEHNGTVDSSNKKKYYYEISNVTKNLTLQESSSCIVEGTLITLADGSKKKVEDLLLTDKLLVFNHNTGTYDIGNILFINNHNNISAERRILNLEFSDGSMLRIVENHGLFDLETLKYEYIDEYNYENYINHRFYKGTLTGEIYESSYATLINAYVTIEETRIYAIITADYMNSFTNDFLSMPTMLSYSNAIVNIFDYNEKLMYDQEKMMADIEKYGLYTYDDFKHLITYESFIASPAMYLKVAIGKGYITEEEILIIINYLLNNGLIQ